MNCAVYYNTRQRVFIFITSSDSIDYLYGCYRSFNEIMGKFPLIITQAFKTHLGYYADDSNFILLNTYSISDGYDHNLKEILLSEYPELFI